MIKEVGNSKTVIHIRGRKKKLVTPGRGDSRKGMRKAGKMREGVGYLRPALKGLRTATQSRKKKRTKNKRYGQERFLALWKPTALKGGSHHILESRARKRNFVLLLRGISARLGKRKTGKEKLL